LFNRPCFAISCRIDSPRQGLATRLRGCLYGEIQASDPERLIARLCTLPWPLWVSNRHCRRTNRMSAFPSKADIVGTVVMSAIYPITSSASSPHRRHLAQTASASRIRFAIASGCEISARWLASISIVFAPDQEVGGSSPPSCTMLVQLRICRKMLAPLRQSCRAG
jgi:hypothetical protein